MDKDIKKLTEESFEEWADIEQKQAEREKKDKKIISLYCSQNLQADVFQIIELLMKFKGMAGHDKDTVMAFKEKYPDKLNIKLLHDFLDVKDLFKEYLESGGTGDE